ncbi:MAG: hypothetical protein ACYDC6_05085 [Acidobacteriaceae bacterium]
MKTSTGSASSGADIGLLLLRRALGLSLFLKHGAEKIMHFSRMSAHFPGPMHIGGHAYSRGMRGVKTRIGSRVPLLD